MYHTVKLLSHGLAFGLIGFLLTPSLAFAEPIAWTGGAGNGSWHSPGNWDLNRVPTEADDVTIGLDGTYTVSVTSTVIARTLVLGGSSGTQTLAVGAPEFYMRSSGTVLPQGVLQLTNPGVQLWVLSAANEVGPFVNSGQINIGIPGGAAGNRHVRCILNNQGTVTLHDGANLTLRYNTTNSGTINVTGGNLSTTVNTVTNTGTIAVGSGRTYRHEGGTLNLNGGTFGGPGANLDLRVTVNHVADFHTADWASIGANGCIFNGPGAFYNDAPGGLSATSCTFNSAFHNIATVESYQCQFATFVNPVGGVLRVRNNINVSTRISSSFTNEGTIVLVDHNLDVRSDNTENAPIGTITNAPTGVIQSGADGFAGGRRRLSANVVNQGTMTAFNAELTMAAATSTVTNSGTISALGGDFSCSYDGEFRNFMNVTNSGTIAISPGRTFRTRGTVTLQGGTLGGPGANLHLTGSTINLAAGDFLTSDWASLDVGYCTFNGPGIVINDRPAGFEPVTVIFNTLVDNRTVLSTPGIIDGTGERCRFNAGLLNPVGATLRVLGDNNSTINSITGGFTNNGTVHIISRGAALSVTGGPLVNNGLIEARREGNPQGTRSIFANINNHGTITNLDVADLRIGQGNQTLTLNNSGTINIQSGALSNNDGVNATNFLTFNNTGAVNFGAGTLYRQTAGTLNLISGTFGGPGSNLSLIDTTVNHSADFHTADWASIYHNGAIFNGPGTFVNDHPEGFTALANTGARPIFNTLVRNVTTFTSHAALFSDGYMNTPGSTLQIRYNVNATVFGNTTFRSSFTNDGVIEVIDPGVALLIQSPSPDFILGTLFNGPTGQIHVRKLETPAAGQRHIKCNIINHGRITVHDVDLQVGEGNYFTSIENMGTFELLGGDLWFPDAPLNKARFINRGVFDMGVDHTVNLTPANNSPPFVFENKRGAILSGSGTIYCATGGPTLDNRIELGGIVRPGGENAVGTLNLLGTVTVPESAFQIGLTIEVDVGGPGPQANDQLNAALLPPQGGRYLRVNVLGSNLPPAGTPFEVGASPYIASNLPVGSGSVCVGCSIGDGPDGACSGALTVLSSGCPAARIAQQPPPFVAACSGDAVISIIAAGESPLAYQWRKDSVPLTDGTTPTGSVISGALTGTLTVIGATEGDEGLYDCVVSNAYGTATSNIATLTVDVADFNCDGFIDGFDYDDFVACFEGASCPPGRSADFNGDGFLDGFDYDDFVLAFETGG